MSDRTVLKFGGKAIRFQKFTLAVIAPVMLLITIVNLKLQWLFTSEVILMWVVIATLYMIAEGIRRVVMGALYIPPAE